MKCTIAALAAAGMMMCAAGSAGAYVVSLGGTGGTQRGIDHDRGRRHDHQLQRRLAAAHYQGGAVVSGSLTRILSPTRRR